MTLSSDQRVKQRINAALAEHNTRVAVLIAENIRRSLDLVEEQSPAVIDAVRDHVNTLMRSQPTSPRRELRAGMISFCKHAAAEARERERRLYHGITGLEEFGPCPDEPHEPNS